MFQGHIPFCSVAQTSAICVDSRSPLLPFLLVQMGACCSHVDLDTRVRKLTCLGLGAIVAVVVIGIPPAGVIGTTGALHALRTFTEDSNEMVLECLDSFFSNIAPKLIWWYKFVCHL